MKKITYANVLDELEIALARLPIFNPVPKPKPKPKKRRKPLARKSATKRTPPPQPNAAIGKGERIRDQLHLERVRLYPCLVRDVDPTAPCGSGPYEGDAPSEAAHNINKGWTGGDEQVFPLCRWHHRERGYSWHALGRPRFCKRFKVRSIEKVCAALYDETLRLRGQHTP